MQIKIKMINYNNILYNLKKYYQMPKKLKITTKF